VLLGREIATLVEGQIAEGYHSATWNAGNVASGFYMARFTATNEFGRIKMVQVDKLILTK
jgi:hypothetical protein